MSRPITFPSPSWLLTAVLVLAIIVPGLLAAAFGDADEGATLVSPTPAMVRVAESLPVGLGAMPVATPPGELDTATILGE